MEIIVFKFIKTINFLLNSLFFDLFLYPIKFAITFSCQNVLIWKLISIRQYAISAI